MFEDSIIQAKHALDDVADTSSTRKTDVYHSILLLCYSLYVGTNELFQFICSMYLKFLHMPNILN